MDPADSDSRCYTDLPPGFLESVLGLLAAHDLASATITCRTLRTLSAPIWKNLAQSTWTVWDPARWAVEQPIDWRKAYGARVRADRRARAAVDELPWPNKHYASLEKIDEIGLDCYDFLTKAAKAEGPLKVGQRYWAWSALSHMRTSLGVAKLGSMPEVSTTEETHVEEAALLLAQMHFPARDMQDVPTYLDRIAEEFLLRVQHEAVELHSTQALQLLSQLLFGDKPADWTSEGEDGQEGPPPLEPRIPPRPHGLGLRGNSEDYYSVSNSLLPDVLRSGLGIPITLAIVHMAVARRAGLPVQLVGVPMHVVNVLSGRAGAEERFIDVFDSGRLLTREQMRAMMVGMGLQPLDKHLAPLSMRGVATRMVANLISIYQQQRNFPLLAMMLRAATVLSPDNLHFHTLTSRVALHLQDYSTARKALQRMQQLNHSDAERGEVERQMFFFQLQQALDSLKAMEAAADAKAVSVKRRPDGCAVRFRVGDIVQHRRYGYRGVVHQWDPQCEDAEESWIVQMGVDNLPGGRGQPFYKVLVDVRDRPFQSTYVAQVNLDLISVQDDADERMELQHPEIGMYFEGRQPGQRHYTPNAYLAAKYPDDYRCQSDEVCSEDPC